MLGRTGLSLTSPEGWLDFEPHESDLRGSRGVAVIGFLMLYMALCNFRNTVGVVFRLDHEPQASSGAVIPGRDTWACLAGCTAGHACIWTHSIAGLVSHARLCHLLMAGPNNGAANESDRHLVTGLPCDGTIGILHL